MATLGLVEAAPWLIVAGNLNAIFNGAWQPRTDLHNGKDSWSKGSYVLYWSDAERGARGAWWYFDNDLDVNNGY